jgi:AhpD family alkylhydroperoxidase
VLQPFNQVHKAALAAGALDTKTKELIALSIAISKQCQGCIVFHVADCIKAGASDKEITEAIGVAVMMGGGPAVMYGCEALSAVKQLRASS